MTEKRYSEMTPEERKAYHSDYSRRRYREQREKLKKRAQDYYELNRASQLVVRADYRDRNRELIRVAQQLGISLDAARQFVAAGDKPAVPVEIDRNDDERFPSAGETPQERVLKDEWRRRLVEGFESAIEGGNFKLFQIADAKLRELIGASDVGQRTKEQIIKNASKMIDDGATTRQVAAMLGVSKSTVQEIKQRAATPTRPTSMSKSSTLSVIVSHGDDEVATFDATGRMVTSMLKQPDLGRFVIMALRRALAAAESTWAASMKEEEEEAEQSLFD